MQHIQADDLYRELLLYSLTVSREQFNIHDILVFLQMVSKAWR